jgi:hypothetical protein
MQMADGEDALSFQLPKHVYDFPLPIELCLFQIIDPPGSHDFNYSGIVVPIENGDIFRLLFLWRFVTSATVTVNSYFLLKCLGLALARSWFRQPPILNHQVACLAADHEAQRKYGERLM